VKDLKSSQFEILHCVQDDEPGELHFFTINYRLIGVHDTLD
jgi:hypothetical protein